MPFRLKPRRPLEQSLRAVAVSELDRVLGQQQTVAHDVPTLVHETRKSIKRLRALLRLARSGLGEEAWQRCNRDLRNVSRQLANRRDNDVRRETIALLMEQAKSDDTGQADILSAFKLMAVSAKRADRQTPSARTEGDTRDRPVATVASQLARIRERLSKLELSTRNAPGTSPPDHGAVIITDGLEATHRKARRSIEIAAAHPEDEAFHELRKVVQIHFRQMQLLTAAWPALMTTRARAAQALAQDLGHDHDLAALASWCGTAAAGLSSKHRDLIQNRCRQEQDKLRHLALAEARRMFGAKPRHFAAEITAGWQQAVEATRPNGRNTGIGSGAVQAPKAVAAIAKKSAAKKSSAGARLGSR